eukprot:EG_transcript_29596
MRSTAAGGHSPGPSLGPPPAGGPGDGDDELAQLKAKLRRQYERTDRWVKLMLQGPEASQPLVALSPLDSSNSPHNGAASKPAEDRPRRRQSPRKPRRTRRQQLQQARALDRLLEAHDLHEAPPPPDDDPEAEALAGGDGGGGGGSGEAPAPVSGAGHRATELRRARDMAAFMADERVGQTPADSWLRRQRSGRFIQELPRFLALHPREL